MADLPLVLAGPLVRRVDPTSASFWLALREPATVTATVWSGPQRSSGAGSVESGDPVVAQGRAATRRFGAHLHVAVVTAAVTTVLAPGRVHSYDLVVDAGGTKGLADLGLLRAGTPVDRADPAAPLHLPLGYEQGRLPSFVTPPPLLADLFLAHASCRKTNGDGPDAMAYLDDVVAEHQGDPLARPQQLFLTGDQIYADEVGACLIGMLNGLGVDLLGFTEQLPLADRSVAATMEQLPATRRERLVRELARFTTTSGENHLLSFGEFAAMYVCALAPFAWRSLAVADQVFVASPNVEANHLTDWEDHLGSLGAWRTKQEPGFAAERVNVEQFRDTVPKVARVLANTATYMVFDDHEVTDDWYLSKRWRTRVLTAPLGAAVVRNALAAYTVFQGWGNDPAAFTHEGAAAVGDNEKLLDTLVDVAASGGMTTGQRDTLDGLLGLTRPVEDPKVRFHYSVPGPKHLVRVLDTRTRRRYVGEGDTPAKLVGDSMDAQLPAGPLTDGRELLVVVSAAPVLFPRVFDTFVQPVAAAVFDLKHHVSGKEAAPVEGPLISGREEFDVEGWHGDEVHHETLLRRLGTYPRVVVLSGDVHFASSMLLDYWGAGDDTMDARIVQLTSSAARNPPTGIKQTVLRALRYGQQGLQGLPLERLGWTGKASIRVPDGQPIRPARRARLRREPGLLTASGWPPGTTIPADKPPDWRWRLVVLRDERATLPVGAPVLPALPAFTPADPVATYAAVAAKHAELALSPQDPIRLMVFKPNVGLVRFRPEGATEVEVRHEIVSPDGPASTTGGAFTEHKVSFARSPAITPPQLQAGP